MRLIRFSWLMIAAFLFWAAHDTASAQARKQAAKQKAPQAPAAKKGVAPGKAASAKSGVAVKSGTAAKSGTGTKHTAAKQTTARNQYKRSTSIRRTYGTGKSTANKRVAASARSKAPAPRRVFYSPGQGLPSQDRYTEIERALSDRGYLKKDPDGKWDQRSADALKQFQQDQNLRADGKLSSMALIALGLGPKRAPAGAVIPPNPARVAPAPSPEPAAPGPDTNK